VAGHHVADDLVDGPTAHQVPGMWSLVDKFGQAGETAVDVEPDDLGSRREDGVEPAFAKPERLLDDLSLGRLYGALLETLIDQQVDVVLVDLRGGFSAGAEQPQDR